MATDQPLARDRELGALEDAWEQASGGRPQLAVVWGRRRVGKTFLLSHFARDKRSVFFGATEQSEPTELRRLGDAVRRDLGPRTMDLAGGGFQDWEAALRFLAALARDEPLVVVLDEVPYLARSTPGFPSVVQVIWDHLEPGTKLMIVLTGSAVGTIDEMLGASGALRGRPTTAFRLDPVSLPGARAFLPSLDPPDLIEAYAACGGYPLHLRAWDPDEPTEENLVALGFTPGGILLEDAQGIFREELPDVGGYPRILAAVARGRTRFSEIASEADQRIEHPLDVLVQAGFVRRSVPVGAPRRARPLYEIPDPYLEFWFGVLYSDLALIEGGQGRVVQRRVRPRWETHVGGVFEEAVRDHAKRLVERGELPEDLVVGRWWTSSGEPAEVDVLGLRGKKTALLGEARWRSAPLDGRDLDALRRRSARAPDPVEDPLYALWGTNGVAEDVAESGVLGFDAGDVVS